MDHEGEDSKAIISITYKDGNETPVPVRVYTCTDEEYQKVYDKLAESQLDATVSGNKVSGIIDVKEAGTLLLTIPYDEGWNIKVDGQKTSAYRVGEALTGIDLGEGTHEISMVFVPEGWNMGCIISLVCVALFILSCLADRYLDKRKLSCSAKQAEEESEPTEQNISYEV